MPRPTASRFPLGFWLLTLLARVGGGAKEVLVALALGASPWKDALVVAWTAPALIASYCNEVLPPLLTPGWVGRAPAGRGAGGMVAAFLGAQLALTAAVLLWPHVLIAAIAPGLPAPTLALAVRLERWLGINLALLSGQALLTTRLNAARRFALTPAARILATGLLLGAVVGSRGWALPRRLTAIAIGLTGGNLLAVGALLIGWRTGCGRAAAPRRAPAAGPGVARGAIAPLLLAMLIVNLIPLAERMAASRLHAGSLAAYDYGERLVQMIFSLSVAPFTAVAFTRLSELAAEGAAGFLRQLESSLGTLLRLATSCAAGLAVFSRLLTRCVFGWGQFNAAAVAATAPVVALKGAGLELDAAVYFLLFALYARGQAAAKLPVALVLAGCNVPLAFAAAARWGVAGLAAAHAASYGAGLGWIWLRRQQYLPGMRWRPLATAAGGAGAVALAAAVGVRALLPRAVVAGTLGGAASCAWAVAAASLTAAAAYLLRRWMALPPSWRRARPARLTGSGRMRGGGARAPRLVLGARP